MYFKNIFNSFYSPLLSVNAQQLKHLIQNIAMDEPMDLAIKRNSSKCMAVLNSAYVWRARLSDTDSKQ